MNEIIEGLKFHDRVMTPNGIATVQGRLIPLGGIAPTHILVHHKPKDLPAEVWLAHTINGKGPCWVAAYPLEQVRKI